MKEEFARYVSVSDITGKITNVWDEWDYLTVRTMHDFTLPNCSIYKVTAKRMKPFSNGFITGTRKTKKGKK